LSAVRLVPAIVDPSATGWCETASGMHQPRKRPAARGRSKANRPLGRARAGAASKASEQRREQKINPAHAIDHRDRPVDGCAR